MFTIGTSSGVITAKPGLDRETEDTYFLSITATDNGSPQLTAVTGVRIFISDTNDNAPVFSPTVYLTSILESTSPGTEVIPVHATDVDLDQNAKIVYSIIGGDPKNQFQVNAYGMISIKAALDRENISFYTLVVQASDQGIPPQTETVPVNVTILDVNDNSPIFDKAAYSVSVLESVPIGTAFLNVTASDADIGDNARLTYSIVSGNTGDVMAVNPSTSALYTVGKYREWWERETELKNVCVCRLAIWLGIRTQPSLSKIGFTTCKIATLFNSNTMRGAQTSRFLIRISATNLQL